MRRYHGQQRPPFAVLRDHVCFHPARVARDVDGERVRPQPGDFYGGWITGALAGPFKGPQGTGGWQGVQAGVVDHD